MKVSRIALATLTASLWTTEAPAANFVGAAGQLGAIYNAGLAPVGVPAVTITGNDVTGVSNPGFFFPYTLDSINNPNAGFTPDFHWVADGGLTPSAGTIWTFAASANEYFVYPTIDHSPLPSEALESSIQGSFDGGSTWIQGTILEVYELGWDAVGVPDDGATRWSFNTPVNMVSMVVGLNQGTYSYGDGDYEIDAVMQTRVPEPSSYVLTLCGLAGLLAWQRRSRPSANKVR